MAAPATTESSERIPVDAYPFQNLGHHSRKVTTTSPDAQIWFNRGFAWASGFNLEEARLCYAEALKCDPECLMAMFGLVGNCGPHYNNPSTFACFFKMRLKKARFSRVSPHLLTRGHTRG